MIIKSGETIKKRSNKGKGCIHCNNFKSDGYRYDYKGIRISDLDIHYLEFHNLINFTLYEMICNINIDNHITFLNINTNAFHIIDGLYQEGSKQIYIDNNKNVFNNNVNRYSEHHGYILFNNSKIDKIITLNQFRVSKNDPTIFLPKQNVELLKQKCIFHTHPTTPYIGSRFKNGIIYEFPSIMDINHFIEHHNRGELQVSLVITPEGLYSIRKKSFNKDKIVIDNDIFINEVERVYKQCLHEIIETYKHSIVFDINNYKINDKYFYKYIASNIGYLIIINKILEKYDITIDFYGRVPIKNNNKINYVFSDVYIPLHKT
jgi:hypothetical protein